jgi:hypothetical protein
VRLRGQAVFRFSLSGTRARRSRPGGSRTETHSNKWVARYWGLYLRGAHLCIRSHYRREMKRVALCGGAGGHKDPRAGCGDNGGACGSHETAEPDGRNTHDIILVLSVLAIRIDLIG